jgi:hypothetical protein
LHRKNYRNKNNKKLFNDKVELIASNIHAQKSICIFNIYVAPFAYISTIVDTISIEKIEMVQSDYVFIVIGDFNIDMCANNQKSKLLQQYMQSLEMQEKK